MDDKLISRRRFLALTAMAAGLLPLDWQRIAAYAAQMGPKSDYPTVVIGAGLGGLCCGAYLAKEGIPVTVLEQSDHPGGYLRLVLRPGRRQIYL
jgi:NADPH-dependent 2,4-dienoyl-CoA reductase/sulfur reductase-like enzyme